MCKRNRFPVPSLTVLLHEVAYIIHAGVAVLGSTLFRVALLFVSLQLCAKAKTLQSHPIPGDKISIQRIIFHSPVRLTPIERRKLDAKIRELRLHSAEDLKELIRELYQDQGYCKAELSLELVPIPGAGIERNTLVVRVRPVKQYHVTR